MMMSSCCHTDFYPPAGPPVTSPFLYSSYSEQHNDEVLKIFDLIQDMKVPILMGDFNHGPGSPGQGRGGGVRGEGEGEGRGEGEGEVRSGGRRRGAFG